jgi:hypothetical protein
MDEQRPSSEAIFTNMLVIWFGLFTSQLMFLAVIYFGAPELFNLDLSRPFLGENGIFVLLFAFLSFVLLGASLFVKSKFTGRGIAEQKPALLQNAMLIGCGMCEMISLFGIILAFGYSYSYFFFYIAFAMAGMMLHFPSRSKVNDASVGGSSRL